MSARVWDARTGEPLTSRLKHEKGRLTQVIFLAGGEYLLTSGLVRDLNSPALKMRLWELPREDKPVADLLQLVTLITGHTLDATGHPVPVSNAVLETTWRDLRRKFPAAFQ